MLVGRTVLKDWSGQGLKLSMVEHFWKLVPRGRLVSRNGTTAGGVVKKGRGRGWNPLFP